MVASDHNGTTNGYDRMQELMAFDATKEGVKGLVDAGITKVPRIFIHPPDELDLQKKLKDHIDDDHLHDDDDDQSKVQNGSQVPIIDFEGMEKETRRKEIVEEIGKASEKWGFFQVVNHGIPENVIEEMASGIKRFCEEPKQVKMKYYTRDRTSKVRFTSNFDLFQSPAANWRDTLYCNMGPEAPLPEEIPQACRDIVTKYSKQVKRLGTVVFELLSEALGLNPNYFQGTDCAKSHVFLGHYYPACPEPELTMGTTKHTDADFLTILLQDQIGGLQVVHDNKWVDVPPIPNSLVINVGDLLQVMSNDRFKSVEHRVLANRRGPRISLACFFTSYPITKPFGPLKELLSEQNPPIYREVAVKEFMSFYEFKGLTGTSPLDRYKL